jgi:hypothetical protein
MMVETMGRCDTPKESIENLLCVKQMYFPEQPVDWGYLLDTFANDYMSFSFGGLPLQERMQFLFLCGISDRLEALALKVWRDHITNMIHTAAFEWGDNSAVAFLHRIREKLTHFEDEILRLKEVTSILELALWKLNLNKKIHQDLSTGRHRK